MSPLESEFNIILRSKGFKEGVDYVREYHFHETRQWRFDFAFPKYKIACECEGLMGKPRWVVMNGKKVKVKSEGGHRSISGFITDAEKYNAAALLGWRVLRVMPSWSIKQVKHRAEIPTAHRVADMVKKIVENG